jgi:arabinogalactan oligomer/maltooligosaccharide transport system substrate-binding protein
MPAPTAVPLTITYWEEEGDDGDVLLDELATAFRKANPGIRVKRIHMSSEELRDRFQAAGVGPEAPDLVRCASDFVGPFSDLRLLRPVTETVDATSLDAFFPGALAAATVKGTLWGSPDNYGNHLMLLYNKALVAEVPANTDAWIAQLKKLTVPAKKQYGLVYYFNEPFWLIPWLGGFGGWPLDAQDNPTLLTPAMADALQFVRDLKFTHKVTPAQADYEGAYSLFKSGQAAYIIDGAWNLDRYRNVGINVGVAALPKVTKTGQYPTPMTSGKYWLFPVRTEGDRLEAAQKFVAYMTSAQAQTAWLETMTRLPSAIEVGRHPKITSDPLLAGAMDQLARGRGLSPAAEMRCAWQGMSRFLEGVMAGTLLPQNAPKLMQAEAETCVKELRSKTQPSN